MKKSILVPATLVTTFVLLFTACNSQGSEPSSNISSADSYSSSSSLPIPESQSVVAPASETKTIDITDSRGNTVTLNYADLYYRYFLKTQMSGIVAESWEHSSEINAGFLVNYFAAQTNWNQALWDDVIVYIPQELVESYVKMYFDVTSEHIRRASDYIPEQEAYLMPMYPWEYPCAITDATAQGNLLKIYYETYNRFRKELPVATQGYLTIEVERYPNLWKYVSNEVTYEATMQ